MNQKEINYYAANEAVEFRRRFDLGQADPIRIDSLLNKLDLLTVFAEMSGDFSGMAARFGNDGFLLINCSVPKGRQIFTICHEFYHLFIQDGFEFEVQRADPRQVHILLMRRIAPSNASATES